MWFNITVPETTFSFHQPLLQLFETTQKFKRETGRVEERI